jgi:hypothetical protein
MCRKFTLVFTPNFVGSLDIRASREVFLIEVRSPEIRKGVKRGRFKRRAFFIIEQLDEHTGLVGDDPVIHAAKHNSTALKMEQRILSGTHFSGKKAVRLRNRKIWRLH